MKKNSKIVADCDYFEKGYALMEMIVVIGIFAILVVLVTQALVLTLRGSKRSDSQNRVRSDIFNAIENIERNLRNATRITNCEELPPINPKLLKQIEYLDETNTPKLFMCFPTAGGLSSLNGPLISNNIKINSCNIVCTSGGGIKPDMIEIKITASDAKFLGSEKDKVEVELSLQLRNF